MKKKSEREQKNLVDLHKLSPEDLQGIELKLNPHEMVQSLGEMVIWGTQNIRTEGRQLRAGGINSIAYGRNRDETGITTINHLISPAGKSIDSDTKESNRIKTKADLQIQTGKDISNQEYHEILRVVQNILQIKGTSLKDIPNPGIGPQLEGLTRILGW